MVVALLGWGLVLVLNLALAPAWHIVVAASAVIALLLLAQVVVGVTETLIKAETAEETYERLTGR